MKTDKNSKNIRFYEIQQKDAHSRTTTEYCHGVNIGSVKNDFEQMNPTLSVMVIAHKHKCVSAFPECGEVHYQTKDNELITKPGH